LALLTYLFCPEEEEDPDVVLERLRIDDISKPNGTLVWLLRYRENDDGFIRLERWQDPAMVLGEVQELAEVLEGRAGEGVDAVRSVLCNAKESAALALSVRDLDSMGWPLAIAAAAHFAETGRGLLQADGSGWMRPDGHEVSWVVEE